MLSSFSPPPSSKNTVQEYMPSVLRGWCTTSGYSLSLKRRPSTRYPVVLQEETAAAPREHKTNQSQPVSPAPPSPPFFFSLFSLFFLPPTVSPPHHAPPTLFPLSLFFYLFLSWAIGLLFMASPIEDALLYKTLEPSRRPTPFEDVAHNSYLGL